LMCRGEIVILSIHSFIHVHTRCIMSATFCFRDDIEFCFHDNIAFCFRDDITFCYMNDFMIRIDSNDCLAKKGFPSQFMSVHHTYTLA
ncbi:hypothetical protein PLESHI_08869, partial [Plesiomonas shigelloides 302-73]